MDCSPELGAKINTFSPLWLFTRVFYHSNRNEARAGDTASLSYCSTFQLLPSVSYTELAGTQRTREPGGQNPERWDLWDRVSGKGAEGGVGQHTQPRMLGECPLWRVGVGVSGVGWKRQWVPVTVIFLTSVTKYWRKAT